MISYIWLISSLSFLLMMAWVAFVEGGVEWSKENIVMLVTMTLFGPLSLIALFSICVHEHREDKKRARCAVIVGDWEKRARGRTKTSNWDWYIDKKVQEERFNQLRETIRSLSDKDLEILSNVSEHTFTVEKPLKEALIDEMLERKILNHDD